MTERFPPAFWADNQSLRTLNLDSPCQATLPGFSCWLWPEQFLVFFRQIWTRTLADKGIQGSRHKSCRPLMVRLGIGEHVLLMALVSVEPARARPLARDADLK